MVAQADSMPRVGSRERSSEQLMVIKKPKWFDPPSLQTGATSLLFSSVLAGSALLFF